MKIRLKCISGMDGTQKGVSIRPSIHPWSLRWAPKGTLKGLGKPSHCLGPFSSSLRRCVRRCFMREELDMKHLVHLVHL